jgi:hypothetical protein
MVVTNPTRFIESTLADLGWYVAAKNNQGSARWAQDLIDEKLDQLKKCGIEAEIRAIH